MDQTRRRVINGERVPASDTGRGKNGKTHKKKRSIIRCNLRGQVYTAEKPAEAGKQKNDETLAAMLVVVSSMIREIEANPLPISVAAKVCSRKELLSYNSRI